MMGYSNYPKLWTLKVSKNITKKIESCFFINFMELFVKGKDS